jgi:hypothetical protein
MREILRQIDANPNIDAINEFNSSTKLRLIVKKDVRPCFFTGNIEQTGKIVTISLNPKYTPEETEREQHGKNFDEWYNFCIERFIQYKSPKDVHNIFKNLRKIVVPMQEWKQGDPRLDLQRDLINLDWCPYYAEKFQTFQSNQLPASLQSWIETVWEHTLNQLLRISSPRCIFVHGKSIEGWVRDHSSNLISIDYVENSYRQKCQLWEGTLNGTRILYLEHFINVVNRMDTLDQIGKVLRAA